MKIHRLFILLLILGAGSPAWSQETRVSASVGRDTIGVHDQLQFVVTVTGEDSGDAANPRLPELRGFKVVSGPNIGTQFQWINGRSSSRKSFTYILVPEKEGQFTIDPVEVRVGDKTYRTEAVQIRVTSAPPSPEPPSRSLRSPWDPFEEDITPVRRPVGDAVFMQAELDRESAYPGQQVTLFYRLYTTMRVGGIQIQETPPLSGFWVEDLEVPETPKGASRRVNGREYLVYTIKKQALFANAAGRLKIPGATFAISVESGRDIFSIFDRSETIYRSTQELTLEVKPLPPEGKPENFSNTVGQFRLSAEIDRNEASTGEAVSLRIKLQGRGNMKTVPDIQFPELPDFTIYSSRQEGKTDVSDGDRIGGEKTWEYVIVPKAPGRQTIPPIAFSFFDPGQNKYETVSTPLMELKVTGGNTDAFGSPGLFDVGKQELTRLGTDIHFIKLAAGTFEKREAPLYGKPWFYLLFALPVALNASVVIYRKRQARLTGNAAAVRSRKARQKALKKLKAAQREARSDARRFYDLAAAALSGYLADRFNLQEIELTSDRLERALSSKEAPAENIEEIKNCLQECDFGRFVSAAASPDRTAALSARIRKIIDALEKMTAGR
ncbi:MAG: protein BatD [Acidobacteria bacterium]|nr:protein BatD [Acidobacteriota bacterium]